MTFEEAKRTCHVRSAIFRATKPETRYWKNTFHPFADVPEKDRAATDWEEYDPREFSDCSLAWD